MHDMDGLKSKRPMQCMLMQHVAIHLPVHSMSH